MHSVPLLYVTNSSSYNDVKVYHANGKDPSPMGSGSFRFMSHLP